MGKPVNSNVPRAETTALNTKVNKEAFEAFKDCCGELGYPMNVMIETFMRQYTNGKFKLNSDDILKFKNDGKEEDTLSTTFNKEICNNFKSTCKANGFFLKHVISAFMEKFANEDFVLEFVTVEDK
jgi:antitoxin component of RelBE/YafQ-DinJ toxin-antitoxin module